MYLLWVNEGVTSLTLTHINLAQEIQYSIKKSFNIIEHNPLVCYVIDTISAYIKYFLTHSIYVRLLFLC